MKYPCHCWICLLLASSALSVAEVGNQQPKHTQTQSFSTVLPTSSTESQEQPAKQSLQQNPLVPSQPSGATQQPPVAAEQQADRAQLKSPNAGMSGDNSSEEAPAAIPLPLDQQQDTLARPAQTVKTGQESQPSDEVVHTSTSASKQFIVQGTDLQLLSAICARVDDIRTGLLHLLGFPNSWKDNIFIVLSKERNSRSITNPVRLSIDIVGNRPHYRITFYTSGGVALESLNNAVTTMLLYEMMLRNVNPEGLPERVGLPQWLLTGIEQAILWRNERADRSMYASLFEHGDILSPLDILKIKDPWKELDATTFVAYQASSGALVLSLLNQKGGKEAIVRLLDEAVLGSDDPEDLIKRNFPHLKLTPASLHKWWSLQLASMATPAVTEALSIQNSEKKLSELLILLQYDSNTRLSRRIPFSDLDTVLQLPDLHKQLSNILNNLVYLSNRCFPTYRPIITDYAKIIALIQNSHVTGDQLDVPGLKKRLQKLDKLRKLSLQAAIRTRDYLDWYEINSHRGLSQTFASYMSTMNMLRNPVPASTTPISKYLDDIEKLYLLPAKAPFPQLSVMPEKVDSGKTSPSRNHQ